MNQREMRVLFVIVMLFSFLASVHASDAKLWIGYGLPANPDLAAAARGEIAKARTRRTIGLATCSNAPALKNCGRQVEITFRTELLGIPKVQLKLYEEIGWILDVRELAIDPDFDQTFCHLEEGRICPLGIHYDDTQQRLARDSDGRTVNLSDKELVEGIRYLHTRMMGLGRNVNSALSTFAGQEKALTTDQVKMLYFFLDHGADPDDRGSLMSGYLDSSGVLRFYSRLILHKSVESNDSRLVRTIVAHGANPNARGGPNSETALMHAASLGLTDITRDLLELGADPGLTDGSGENALQKAEKSKNLATATLLRTWKRPG